MHFKPGEALTFKSVVSVRARLHQALMDEQGDIFRLDLSEVTECDSAGLALLIEARRMCQGSNKTLEVLGMSDKTQSLAEFCGVKSILDSCCTRSC